LHAGDWIALGTLVVVALTLIVYWFLLQATRDQVTELRKQTDENHSQNLEAQHDRYRPLVYPTGNIPATDDGRYVDWGRGRWGVDLKNAGAGVALTICGVFFGPKPTRPDHAKTERYTLWRDQPLLAQEQRSAAPMEFGASMVSGHDIIDSHTLYAPPEPTYDEMLQGTPWVVARLTLTYRDIFGRKHASISDYHQLHGWQPVAFLANITDDLIDLDCRARP
jgi:hypothetical protein